MARVPGQARPAAVDAALRQFVAEAVADAVRAHDHDFESQRERARQAHVEDRVQRATGGIDARVQDEADDDEPLTHKGAPTRAPTPPPDTTVKSPGGVEQEPLATDAPPGGPAPAGTDNVTSTSLIDKFNIIRSGRSMNDRDVADALERYLDGLPDIERRTMLSVLQGIGGIVAPGQDVGRLEKPEKQEPPGQQQARLAMLQRHRQSSASGTPPPPGAPPTPRPSPEEPEDREREDRSPPVRVRTGPRR